MASYLKLPKGTKLPKKPAGTSSRKGVKDAKANEAAVKAYLGKRTPRTPPTPEVNPGTRPKRPVGRTPSKRPLPSRPIRSPVKPMPTPRPGSGPKPKPKTPTRPSRPTRRPTRRSPLLGIRRSLRNRRGRR